MPTFAEAMRTNKESLAFLRAKASKRPFPIVGVERLAAAAKLTLIFEFWWSYQNFGRVVVLALCGRPMLELPHNIRLQAAGRRVLLKVREKGCLAPREFARLSSHC